MPLPPQAGAARFGKSPVIHIAAGAAFLDFAADQISQTIRVFIGKLAAGKSDSTTSPLCCRGIAAKIMHGLVFQSVENGLI